MPLRPLPRFGDWRRRSGSCDHVDLEHSDLRTFFGRSLAGHRSDSPTAARYNHDLSNNPRVRKFS